MAWYCFESMTSGNFPESSRNYISEKNLLWNNVSCIWVPEHITRKYAMWLYGVSRAFTVAETAVPTSALIKHHRSTLKLMNSSLIVFFFPHQKKCIRNAETALFLTRVRMKRYFERRSLGFLGSQQFTIIIFKN